MIDVNNLGGSSFAGDDHVNLNLQSDMQWNRAEDQGSMAVDDNRFAIARYRFSKAVSRNYNPQ